MAANKGMDKYGNLAIISATESAAGTLTFKKLETGTSLFDKVGVLIHRVEWYPGSDIGLILATADRIFAGITNTNTLTDLGATQDGVMIRKVWRRADFGTAASGQLYIEPDVDDYSQLPGGGMLMMPNPIYLGVQGVSLASACTVTCRILFTFVSLTNEDFFELMQARQTLIAT